MLIPSKFTKLEESIIFKMISILVERGEEESVEDLYVRTKESFADTSEFLYALDVLYVLDKINVNFETSVVSYVD